MTRQTGYALILMVVVLMGIGGVAITGFTRGAKQDTEHQRYLHNQRMLKEAKQALLQYAYNYPITNDLGPGRLPNADTDNDGISEDGSTFGRLPWAQPNLNLYDIRDADGQRLWYAVSSSFRPQAAAINSSTSGTITLRDQTGGIIFDGSNAADLDQYGIAAVIIAPGAVTDRNGVSQDRSVANGDDPFDYTEAVGNDDDEDTDPGIITASNYLDLVVGTEDNADFTHSDAANGLILGPVNNLTNDQFIVITAAEVIAMAEKATLQAYRDSINVYLNNVACTGETPDGSGTTEALCLANGGVWDPVYPWLYNYDGIEYDVGGGELVDVAIDKLSTYFPADANFATEKGNYLGIDTDGIFGRIPSTFAEYFTEVNSQAIETRLGGSMTLIDPVTAPDTFTLTETFCNSCPQGTTGSRLFDPGVEGPVLHFESTQILTGVRFVDIDPGAIGDDVRIIATFPTPESIPFDLYFLGVHNTPGTVWTACPEDQFGVNPGGANELSDCNGLSSNRSILHLQGTIDFSGVDQEFDFDNTTLPTIAWSRASDAAHAWITGTYPANGIISFPGVISSVTYEYEGDWNMVDTLIDTGDITYATGTVDITGFSLASLTLGIRYYPELPAWALNNGWHNAMRMAYARGYEPGGTGPCIIDSTCLNLEDSPAGPQDKISLLVIAGQHNWQDSDGDGTLEDELEPVFDGGNHNDNHTFYRHIGNDKILVIDEL